MTFRVLVQPAAEADIVVAALWYESRALGLGAEFLRSVEAGVAAIQRGPETLPKIHGDVRRVMLRRFPFALYFVLDPPMVRVVACLHVRRDPAHWRRRARGRPEE